MENTVQIKGIISDIKHSHSTGIIQYSTCKLVQGDNVIDLIFKEGLVDKIHEGDELSITGSLRSYLASNHKRLYVNTYFDPADEENKVILEGIIQNKEDLYTYPNGKCNIHFLLENKIYVESLGKTFVNLIPCVAHNQVARDLENFTENKIRIEGKIKSRTYMKDDIFKVTHEIEVIRFESIV